MTTATPKGNLNPAVLFHNINRNSSVDIGRPNESNLQKINRHIPKDSSRPENQSMKIGSDKNSNQVIFYRLITEIGENR